MIAELSYLTDSVLFYKELEVNRGVLARSTHETTWTVRVISNSSSAITNRVTLILLAALHVVLLRTSAKSGDNNGRMYFL